MSPDLHSTPADETDPLPRAAAIRAGDDSDIDGLLAALAGRMRAAGRRVRGLLMDFPQGREACGEMVLVDIHSGERFGVSQPLGSLSAGCRADLQGFARASGVLRRALEENAELVIVNRFGSLESEGGGFASELLELMAAGIPLLTAVRAPYVDAWTRFTGGAALIDANLGAIEEWLGGCLPGTSPTASVGPG